VAVQLEREPSPESWTGGHRRRKPTLEDRHRTGIKVILFLLAMTGILYAGKRRIWAAVH